MGSLVAPPTNVTLMKDALRLGVVMLHVFAKCSLGFIILFGLQEEKKWPLTLTCHNFFSPMSLNFKKSAFKLLGFFVFAREGMGLYS